MWPTASGGTAGIAAVDMFSRAASRPSWCKRGLVLGGERFAEEAGDGIKVNGKGGDRGWLRGRWTWEGVVRAVEKTRGGKWADFANRHGDAGLGMAFYVARRCTGLTLRQL